MRIRMMTIVMDERIRMMTTVMDEDKEDDDSDG